MVNGYLERWLAVEPGHLPSYGHTAVVVGTVIILTVIVLIALGVLVLAWSRRGR